MSAGLEATEAECADGRSQMKAPPMMDFGEALQELKIGRRVTRAGWNGKGMFAYLVPAAAYPVQTGAAKEHFGEGAMVPYRAYLALKTVDDDVAVWMPSVSDILADDWSTIEAEKFERMDAEIRPPYAHEAPMPQVDTPEGMTRHIGTKIVDAKPMTRAEYVAFRGWDMPADENPADQGYLVHYTDGGKPNVEGFPGYVSWSPKDQFDEAYRAL